MKTDLKDFKIYMENLPNMRLLFENILNNRGISSKNIRKTIKDLKLPRNKTVEYIGILDKNCHLIKFKLYRMNSGAPNIHYRLTQRGTKYLLNRISKTNLDE